MCATCSNAVVQCSRASSFESWTEQASRGQSVEQDSLLREKLGRLSLPTVSAAQTRATRRRAATVFSPRCARAPSTAQASVSQVRRQSLPRADAHRDDERKQPFDMAGERADGERDERTTEVVWGEGARPLGRGRRGDDKRRRRERRGRRRRRCTSAGQISLFLDVLQERRDESARACGRGARASSSLRGRVGRTSPPSSSTYSSSSSMPASWYCWYSATRSCMLLRVRGRGRERERRVSRSSRAEVRLEKVAVCERERAGRTSRPR